MMGYLFRTRNSSNRLDNWRSNWNRRKWKSNSWLL